MYLQQEQEAQGTSASSTPAAKQTKAAQKEDKKTDLHNQLEKARLEGLREALEKREAALATSQGTSGRGGGCGRELSLIHI